MAMLLTESFFRQSFLPGGPILLGDTACCDGFSLKPVRVITHAHDDHIKDFETSLGHHDAILMLPATLDILYAIKGRRSLEIRRNLLAIDAEKSFEFNQNKISLRPANHMLGSSQVLVETHDGLRLGYSGDFAWPIEPFAVDELVVDATYGNPDYIRPYREEDAVEEFIELVETLLKEERRICIKAFTGRLQYAMQLLQDRVHLPFLAGKKQASIAEAYQKYGVLINPVLSRHSEEGKRLIAEGGPYIAFHHLAERVPETDYDTCIFVSSYMVPREKPLVRTMFGHYRVAITDHADFNQTIDYVAAAGPKLVVVDNSRGGDAVTLAAEIKSRLNIPTLVGG